jgi:long-chain fatty acid transport protein
MRLSVSSLVALALLAAGAARASGPLSFQHGGLGTAEVGALTARADSAGAMSYNPAAIAHLAAGGSYQLGLDFTAPTDSYESSTFGKFDADHLITESPGLYASWHLPKDYYPWAFGLGIDNVADYQVSWSTALFPGRYRSNQQRLDLLALHPVVAYELGDRWSIGAGARYIRGSIESGNTQLLQVPGSGGQVYAVDASRFASTSNADGTSFDAGVQYQAPGWGFGLAYDSGGKVKGSGELKYSWRRDIPSDPALAANLERLLPDGSSSQSFKIPAQMRTGVTLGHPQGWRLELDAVWTQWSSLDSTSVTYEPNTFAILAGHPGTTTETTRRDWKDTLSWRLGAEGNLSTHWLLGLGFAMEPSPIPSDRIEPGFPRGGDAQVYGVGFGYLVEHVRFEISYSFYQYGSTGVVGQELAHPSVPGTYTTRDQAFALSASWHH